jgi:DNA-binding transcriptional regulator of glucitol operon
MTPRISPGDLLVLSAVSMAAATLMALLAWAQMRAFGTATGAICGTGGVQIGHCPACYGAAAFLALAVLFLGLARVAGRRAVAVRR